jgi:hypothetical protein
VLQGVRKKILKSAERTIDVARSRAFDLFHNVETCGDVSLRDLSVSVIAAEGCCKYMPTPATSIRRMFTELDVNFREFTFVDIGSGKGIALLIASEYPFHSIIGVEFAEELHRTADRNIRRYRGRRRCHNIRSEHCDAREFKFPDDPLILYFFNPFRDQVMARVMSNLLESVRGNPREVILACQTPFWSKDVLVSTPGIMLWHSVRYFDFYRISLGSSQDA